jgi:hypothetical protein
MTSEKRKREPDLIDMALLGRKNIRMVGWLGARGGGQSGEEGKKRGGSGRSDVKRIKRRRRRRKKEEAGAEYAQQLMMDGFESIRRRRGKARGTTRPSSVEERSWGGRRDERRRCDGLRRDEI